MIAEQICPKLVLPKALETPRAFRHPVLEAVREEQRALFVGQIVWPAAINVGNLIADHLNGVLCGDDLKASRAFLAHGGVSGTWRGLHSQMPQGLDAAVRVKPASPMEGEEEATLFAP